MHGVCFIKVEISGHFLLPRTNRKRNKFLAPEEELCDVIQCSAGDAF